MGSGRKVGYYEQKSQAKESEVAKTSKDQKSR